MTVLNKVSMHKFKALQATKSDYKRELEASQARKKEKANQNMLVIILSIFIITITGLLAYTLYSVMQTSTEKTNTMYYNLGYEAGSSMCIEREVVLSKDVK